MVLPSDSQTYHGCGTLWSQSLSWQHHSLALQVLPSYTTSDDMEQSDTIWHNSRWRILGEPRGCWQYPVVPLSSRQCSLGTTGLIQERPKACNQHCGIVHESDAFNFFKNTFRIVGLYLFIYFYLQALLSCEGTNT